MKDEVKEKMLISVMIVLPAVCVMFLVLSSISFMRPFLWFSFASWCLIVATFVILTVLLWKGRAEWASDPEVYPDGTIYRNVKPRITKIQAVGQAIGMLCTLIILFVYV